MRDLLDLAIASHGGFERWSKVRTIDGDVSVTGTTWARKGWPDALKNIHVTAHTQNQFLAISPFTTGGRRSRYTPDYVAIETLEGEILKERRNPRSAFDGHTVETQWDDLHLAYFTGYAMWNYLNTPFLFAKPGFQVEELSPWNENGHERRRLRVIFPDSIATHSAEQVFYFDDDYLVTRFDYISHVSGGVPAAHYLSDYKNFDGIKFATKRRAYLRDPDNTPKTDRILVAIDFSAITFS